VFSGIRSPFVRRTDGEWIRRPLVRGGHRSAIHGGKRRAPSCPVRSGNANRPPPSGSAPIRQGIRRTDRRAPSLPRPAESGQDRGGGPLACKRAAILRCVIVRFCRPARRRRHSGWGIFACGRQARRRSGQFGVAVRQLERRGKYSSNRSATQRDGRGRTLAQRGAATAGYSFRTAPSVRPSPKNRGARRTRPRAGRKFRAVRPRVVAGEAVRRAAKPAGSSASAAANGFDCPAPHSGRVGSRRRRF